MENQYPNNTSKKQVKNPQKSSPLLSRPSQGPLLLPKIPQQRQPLPSNILQQNLPLPPKLPPLLPKAPQNPPLPPNFLQQNSLLYSQIPQQPQGVYNYVQVPQGHYSYLHSGTSEMNQFYPTDPYFNSDTEKEQPLLTKVQLLIFFF